MAWRPRRENIRTLQDAASANVLLWLFCVVCGHAERADPFKLALKTGKNVALADQRPRLKCKRCGVKGHTEVFPSEQRAMAER